MPSATPSADGAPNGAPNGGPICVSDTMPDNLMPKQQDAYVRFSQTLKVEGLLPPPQEQPHYLQLQLLRFLRARSFDVDAALLMWRKCLEWRKEYDMDGLMESFDFTEREAVGEHGWRHYFHKTDKMGRPIYVQDLANLDPVKVFTCTTDTRIIASYAVTLECAIRHRYSAATEAAGGKLVRDNFMIVNIQGLGVTTFWGMRNQLKKLLDILDNNFPELSGKIYIINSPWVFTQVWSFIKPWLRPATLEKVDILGADYAGTLLQHVEPQNLPKHLGGKCKCPEGCVRSDAGPWDQRLTAITGGRRKE